MIKQMLLLLAACDGENVVVLVPISFQSLAYLGSGVGDIGNLGTETEAKATNELVDSLPFTVLV